VSITAYVLFILAGLAFGYAAPGRLKWLPLLFPIALFLGAAASEGIDGAMIFRLILALIVTGVGVVLGSIAEQRFGREPAAA
jgi:hypothetical protein